MNINFTGKYFLYGQKRTVDATKNKIKSESERFNSFDINYNEHKLSIVATGKDCVTLQNASQEAEFKETIQQIVKERKGVAQKIAKYIFGTDKDIPLLQQKTLEETLRYKKSFEDIEYVSGAHPIIKNKKHIIRYVDGSTRLFSNKGKELEQRFKDGTILQETVTGTKTYTYPTGIIEKFNKNNILLSRRYPNGTEEFFDKINARIKMRILPNGKVIRFCYSNGKVSGVLDENNNQGKVNENGDIDWLDAPKIPEKTLSNNTGKFNTKITRSGIIQKCVGRLLVEERFPDGRIKKYDQYGIIEIYPDGRIYHYNRYGKPLDF